MNSTSFKTIQRSDYQPPGFLVDTIDLLFRLDEQCTIVTARSKIKKNPEHENNNDDLVLYGENLELVKVSIDGEEIDSGRMVVTENELELDHERVTAKLDEMCSPYENPDDIKNIYLQNQQLMSQIQNMVLEEQIVAFLTDQAQLSSKSMTFSEVMELAG